MDKFELDFDSNELDIMERPRPIQMMEPSLRTTVFVAQIQAGLWRRNGHSLIDQVNAYHDPRFRYFCSIHLLVQKQLWSCTIFFDHIQYFLNAVKYF